MTTPNEIATTVEPEVTAPVWQPDISPATAPNAEDVAAATAAHATPDTNTQLGAVSAPARRAGSTTALLVVAAMVALGGVGFAAGRATAPAQTTTSQTTIAAANGLPAAQGAAPALGAIPSGGAPGLDGPDGGPDGASTISGTVVSATSSSITIKLVDGQTVTVATGSSTVYHSQTTASSSAVTAGASVVVQTSTAASASAGTEGSRTATNVIVTGK